MVDFTKLAADADASRAKAKSFEEAAAPLMKWLAENKHPHHTAVVTSTRAELNESVLSTGETMKYIRG